MIQKCKKVIKTRLSPTIYFVILQFLINTIYSSQYCKSLISPSASQCTPCYYRCKECSFTGPSSCTQCLQQYILFDSLCIACGDNCQSCSTVVDLINLNQKIISKMCQTCVQGYYLSQSMGVCVKCPSGARDCTLSAIQQCLDGFYQENGLCLACQINCDQCTSSASCSLCSNTYYITSSNQCASCNIKNCASCNIDQSCNSCVSGYSGLTCTQVCQQNCNVCQGSICYVCNNGFYLSNGVCLALRLLCTSGNTFSTCQECLAGYAVMDQTNTYCLPLDTVKDVNRFTYITAFNNINSFSANANMLTETIYCPELNLRFTDNSAANIKITQKIQPSFALNIMIQVKVTNKNDTILVQSNGLSFGQSSNYSCQKFSSVACSSSTFYISNMIIYIQLSSLFNCSSTPLVVSLSSSLGLTVEISQLSIEQFRCQITSCLFCQSSYTCASCQYPYLLQNNQCVQSCDYGYYFVQDKRQCILTCIDGYYPLRQEYICQLCVSPCIVCEGSNICLKCANTTKQYYLYGNNCVEICPQYFYSDPQLGDCEQCVFPCNDCSTQNNCTSCTTGYLNMENLKCTVQCPNGKYSDFTLLACEICQNPCLTCQYSSTSCTSCIALYALIQSASICVLTCPSGSTFQTALTNSPLSINTCVSCSYPCKNCFGQSTNCTSCFSGYLASTFKCVLQCPSLYFASINFIDPVCVLCVNPCKTCIDQFICSSCISGYKLNILQKFCVVNCPDGTYSSTINITQTKCEQCVPPCLYCSNQTYCTSCTGLLFLNHLGQCLLQCPIGTFVFYNTTLQERQCVSCPDNCEQCLSQINCEACKDGWLLYSGVCYKTCPLTTFPNQEGYNFCELCQYPCLNCINQYQCTSCVSGFLYQKVSKACLQFCPSGYLQNSVNMTCEICNLKCASCIGTIDHCITCSSAYYFDQVIQKCVSTCPSGSYASNLQNICNLCFLPCKQCTSATTCLSCYQLNSTSVSINLNYILYLSQCVNQCPNGYFERLDLQNVTICGQCQSQCQQCSIVSNNCTLCKSPYISLYIGTTSYPQCLKRCPDAYFQIVGICQSCQQPCKSCITLRICTVCIDNWYLLEGQCLQSCPILYFPTIVNTLSICSRCSSQCYECQNSSTSCLSCTRNYYIYIRNNFPTCVKTCPQMYYPTSSFMKCVPCIPPCIDCYSDSSCKSCLQGYILQGVNCLDKCQLNYFKSPNNSSQCILCVSPCLTCLSNTQCSSCVSGYYYLDSNSSCILNCPSKMYKKEEQPSAEISAISNSMSGVCLACSQICIQCLYYSVCISCDQKSQRKYLQNNKCQLNCTDGHYLQSDPSEFYSLTCHSCAFNCISCNSGLTCQKCISSYLFNNSCYSSCPTTYYSSSSFTCLSCQSPCLTCYNSINCLSCVPKFYLYNNVCIKKCPQFMWTDLSTQICLSICSHTKFMNVGNMTCLDACPQVYTTDRYCNNTCSSTQNYFINQTKGCQLCFDNCKEIKAALSYKLDYMLDNGKFYILVKFADYMRQLQTNQPINIFDTNFNVSLALKTSLNDELLIDLLLDYNQNTNPQQITISSAPKSRRMLQNIQNSTNYNANHLILDISSVQTIGLLQNSFMLQISSIPTFSGSLSISLSNILVLQSKSSYTLIEPQNLPFQSLQESLTIQYFNKDHVLPQQFIGFMKIIGKIFVYLGLTLLVLNLITDNLKANFYFIDFMQVLGVMVFIGRDTYLGINQFITNFQITVFLIDMNAKSSDFVLFFNQQLESLQISRVWNCSSMHMLYGNACDFKSYYIVLLIFVGVFIALIVLFRLLTQIFRQKLQKIHLHLSHAIFYNHMNNFYWLFITGFWFVAGSDYYFNVNKQSFEQSIGISNQSQIGKMISIIIMTLCVALTVVLGFQLLKNVFNSSFEEKSFFWGLKRHKVKNQQANIHFLLLMIRKTILLLSIVFSSSSSSSRLLFFFLLVLISLVILSNILANEPFKNRTYQYLIVVVQFSMVLFYLGIQIYIVNVQKFNQITYVVYNVGLFVLAFIILTILTAIAIRQTWKHFKRLSNKYQKLKAEEAGQQNALQGENDNSSSNTDPKSIPQIESEKRHKKRFNTNKTTSKIPSFKDIKQKEFTLLHASLRSIKPKRELNYPSNQLLTHHDNRQNADQESSMQPEQKGFGFQFQDKNSVDQDQFQRPAKFLVKFQKRIGHTNTNNLQNQSNQDNKHSQNQALYDYNNFQTEVNQNKHDLQNLANKSNHNLLKQVNIDYKNESIQIIAQNNQKRNEQKDQKVKFKTTHEIFEPAYQKTLQFEYKVNKSSKTITTKTNKQIYIEQMQLNSSKKQQFSQFP